MDPGSWPDVNVAALSLRRDDVPWDASIALVHPHDFGGWEERALQLLCPSEAKTLASLTSPRRRRSFLLGRIAAKAALLHHRRSGDPLAIEIRPGIFGQPVVACAGPDPTGVSITHSDLGAAAVAFREEHPMGIDFETVDPAQLDVLRSVLTLAERYMATEDPAGEPVAATALWTAKEALSKVLRCGLTAPFEVLALESFKPLAPAFWEGTFVNFAQYRSLTWVEEEVVMSLVLPKKSQLIDAPGLLRACLKIRTGSVFAERAGWRGATREHGKGGCPHAANMLNL